MIKKEQILNKTQVIFLSVRLFSIMKMIITSRKHNTELSKDPAIANNVKNPQPIMACMRTKKFAIE